MAQSTITTGNSYVPARDEFKKIDSNFDENYSSIADLESDVTDVKAGEGITLTEYANNAAAVTGGLSIGNLYMTTGAVMVVTA